MDLLDSLLAVGLVLIVLGVGLMYLPAGVIVCGCLLVFVSIRVKPQPRGGERQ